MTQVLSMCICGHPLEDHRSTTLKCLVCSCSLYQYSQRRTYSLHPRAIQMRDYRARNPSYYQRGILESKTRLWRLRLNLIRELGNVCIDCGINDPLVLQLHHKNNDGRQDRKKHGGHAKTAYYYLTHIEEAKQKLQMLCANCHQRRLSRGRD